MPSPRLSEATRRASQTSSKVRQAIIDANAEAGNLPTIEWNGACYATAHDVAFYVANSLVMLWQTRDIDGNAEFQWKAAFDAIEAVPKDWTMEPAGIEKEAAVAIVAIQPSAEGELSEPVFADRVRGEIVVDGESHQAEPHYCVIVEALLDAQGLYVTGPAMLKLAGCRGKKISREIAAIERKIPVLKKYLRHEGNKGVPHGFLKVVPHCPSLSFDRTSRHVYPRM